MTDQWKSGSGVPPLTPDDQSRHGSTTLAVEQLAWLSIEPDDFDFAPFLVSPKPGDGGSQQGGPGKAHQLFGAELLQLLNELNEVLIT